MLTTYITLTHLKENPKSFSIIGFIIARFLRLTPQLAIVISLSLIVPLLGSGPLWTEVMTTFIGPCYENWWTNLAYIQNFVRTYNQCLIHTWYTACDMQYHLLSILVMIPLVYFSTGKKGYGYLVNISIVVIFYFACWIGVNAYQLPPAIINTARK